MEWIFSLVAFDKNTQDIYWSGANNPLWYFENDEMSVIKPNKQPIGKTEIATKFTTHQLHLKQGSYLFLFTDGYADQFGGDSQAIRNKGGKKLMYKQFQKLLTHSISKSPEEIKHNLENKLNAWQGQLE